MSAWRASDLRRASGPYLMRSNSFLMRGESMERKSRQNRREHFGKGERGEARLSCSENLEFFLRRQRGQALSEYIIIALFGVIVLYGIFEGITAALGGNPWTHGYAFLATCVCLPFP